MCRRVSQIHADRARTVLGADPAQPLPDLAEGFVPADRLEPIADAAYRRAEPIRIVVQRSHRRGLGTDISLGQHIVGISLDPDDAVAFDGDPDSAVRLTQGALSRNNASIHGTSSHARGISQRTGASGLGTAPPDRPLPPADLVEQGAAV